MFIETTPHLRNKYSIKTSPPLNFILIDTHTSTHHPSNHISDICPLCLPCAGWVKESMLKAFLLQHRLSFPWHPNPQQTEQACTHTCRHTHTLERTLEHTAHQRFRGHTTRTRGPMVNNNNKPPSFSGCRGQNRQLCGQWLCRGLIGLRAASVRGRPHSDSALQTHIA